MDLRRLRTGELIAGLAGVMLLVSLVLPWYTQEVVTSFGPRPSLPSQNAFEAMAIADVPLLIVALAAVGLTMITALEKTVAIPLTWASLLCFASLVALVIVLVHLGMNPSSSARVAESRVETSTAAGAWLALLAVVAMVAGALVAMRDERLSRGGRLTDQTGRPVDRAPDIEQLAAPR